MLCFFLGELMSGAGMAGVTYFASNKDDPYITLADPVSQNSITGLDIYYIRFSSYEHSFITQSLE